MTTRGRASAKAFELNKKIRNILEESRSRRSTFVTFGSLILSLGGDDVISNSELDDVLARLEKDNDFFFKFKYDAHRGIIHI